MQFTSNVSQQGLANAPTIADMVAAQNAPAQIQKDTADLRTSSILNADNAGKLQVNNAIRDKQLLSMEADKITAERTTQSDEQLKSEAMAQRGQQAPQQQAPAPMQQAPAPMQQAPQQQAQQAPAPMLQAVPQQAPQQQAPAPMQPADSGAQTYAVGLGQVDSRPLDQAPAAQTASSMQQARAMDDQVALQKTAAPMDSTPSTMVARDSSQQQPAQNNAPAAQMAPGNAPQMAPPVSSDLSGVPSGAQSLPLGTQSQDAPRTTDPQQLTSAAQSPQGGVAAGPTSTGQAVGPTSTAQPSASDASAGPAAGSPSNPHTLDSVSQVIQNTAVTKEGSVNPLSNEVINRHVAVIQQLAAEGIIRPDIAQEKITALISTRTSMQQAAADLALHQANAVGKQQDNSKEHLANALQEQRFQAISIKPIVEMIKNGDIIGAKMGLQAYNQGVPDPSLKLDLNLDKPADLNRAMFLGTKSAGAQSYALDLQKAQGDINYKRAETAEKMKGTAVLDAPGYTTQPYYTMNADGTQNTSTRVVDAMGNPVNSTGEVTGAAVGFKQAIVPPEFKQFRGNDGATYTQNLKNPNGPITRNSGGQVTTVGQLPAGSVPVDHIDPEQYNRATNGTINGAAHTITEGLSTIVGLPAGTNGGVSAKIRIGASEGGMRTSITGGPGDAVINTVLGPDAQRINTANAKFLDGLSRITPGGGNDAKDLANTFKFEPGDKQITYLEKTAAMRSEAVSRMQAAAQNPHLTTAQRQEVNDGVTRIQRMIPYTSQDVTNYQSAVGANPKLTMDQYVKTKTALPRAATPADAQRLGPGKQFVDPQGNVRTVPGKPA